MPAAARVREDLRKLGGLASYSELADRWGVTHQRARQLCHEQQFPAPVLTLGGKKLWIVAEADAFRNRRSAAV